MTGVAHNMKAKVIELNCSCCNKTFSRLLRLHKKYKTRKNIYCSRTCSAKTIGKRDKMGLNNPNYNNGEKILGNKNPNWRGGTTYTIKQIRKSLGYFNWRNDILKRDNYSCTVCNSKENLEVDHIIPLRDSLELALNIDNGRTLCKICHQKTDTFGAKAWKRKVS